MVDFELFRPELDAALGRSDRARGGRPPYDPVLMFRILVLQTLYTLSDDQTEYQLRDRLSFMRFVGLALHDASPTPRRFGCSASNWSAPGHSSGCLRGSTRRWPSAATWPWAARSWTRPSSKRAARG